MRKPLHQDHYELANGGKKEKIADLWVGFAQFFFGLGLGELPGLHFPTYFERHIQSRYAPATTKKETEMRLPIS